MLRDAQQFGYWKITWEADSGCGEWEEDDIGA